MTPDLQRLQAASTLGPIIERLELELVDDPNWAEPSDTSYLSDADRANPDIVANVDAMLATNKLIAWFGRDSEGFVGIWRGPGERPLTEAPIVRLDTEGQYSIVAATIPDYIAISVPEDEFQAVRAALVGAGFKVGNNPDAVWGALDAFDDDPNGYRNELYEQNRTARGLGDADAGDDDEAAPEPAPPSVTAPVIEAQVVLEVTIDEDVDDGADETADAAHDGGDEDEDDDDGADVAADDDDDGDEDDAPAAKPAAKAPARKPAANANAAAAKAPAHTPAAKAKAAKAPAAAKAKAAKAPAAAKAKAAAHEPAAKKPVAKAAAKKPAAKQPAAKQPAAKKPAAKKPAAKQPGRKR